MNASVWAIVPVKPFRQAKSRLRPVLDAEQRAALSRDFLGHALGVLARVPSIARTLVVSRDPVALAAARDLGAATLDEDGAVGLNAALQRATRAAVAGRARAVLVLPSDLPLLEPADVEQLLAEAGDGPVVAIVPDRHEQGTNALLVRPPGGLEYAFGEGSFARHQVLARKTGACVRICRLPRAALDVDVPDDWVLYQAAR